MKNTIAIFLLVCTIFFNVFEAYAKEENKKSIEQIRELAKKGDSKSQYKLGDIYFEGKEVEKDYNEAIKWFRKAAKQGDLDAFIALGNCYYGGIGVEKDAVEAIKWFRKAADQGDARAQCNLGFCYGGGIGVEKDAVEAIKWFRKAADQGNADGQFSLGLCYRFGIGVEKDAVEAIKWYRKAADQGDADGQFSLGNCYYGGIGVEKDAVEAIKWYRKAADQGDARAQFNLGGCYRLGIGVEKDAVEAIKWYRKAADQGYLDAFVELGDCYQYGDIGVEKDAVEAIKWYRKAADQGNVDAQCKLASCYQFGIGVEKDAVESIKWYRKAADQGDTFAKKKIDEYEAELKAAEERRIAEEKAAEKRRVAACDEYWNGLASNINEHKTYNDREEYLQTVKSQLLHDNNDGTVLLDEFASEYLPNTYSKYEKAREKSLEIGQNLKSVFTKQLDNNSPEWSTYLKATEKYSQILWEEKRIQNGISYIYLLHKVGACSDELLAALDKSEKMNFTFEDDFKHDLNQYQAKKVDGVMEFAQKNMPETFALLEAFEKEINETKVQFDGIYAEASKLNYFFGNTTHSVFVAFEFKYRRTIEKYNAIMPQVKDLQVKHLLLEVTGEDLASQDSKIAKEHKAFKDSLPEFIKTNAHKREAIFVDEIIENMVQIPEKNYLLGKYEVTQAQWQLIMGENPSRFKGDLSRPVEQVSWNDCQKFIEKLNSYSNETGYTFFLPTEEEWEYACRAGSTGKYGLLADGREGTLDEMGWYDDNSGSKTHPVGQKKPNAWGLYDMHGNVWEWTASEYGDNRFFRGGSWGSYDWNCWAGSGYDDGRPNDRFNGLVGFRLAASRTEK